MSRRLKLACAWLAILLFVGFCTAQFRRWRNRGDGHIHYTEGNVMVDEDTMSTAREVASHSTDAPVWTNTPGFEKDAFTFCRIVFPPNPNGSSVGTWITDFPDSDLNLSFRLQQMTSLLVSPAGRFLRLKNKELFDYPWIYMVEPGGLLLTDEDAEILRRYLLNGGFLMADDFWGELQWRNFHEQIKKVFPAREFEELPMEHPIFHTVFDIKVPKQELQTPNYRQGIRSLIPGSRDYGITWEYYHDDIVADGAREMHVRAIKDDKGRIMVVATHNCDNGDGWEREGENDDFFHVFSEKRAFPLGINIIFYAMTH